MQAIPCERLFARATDMRQLNSSIQTTLQRRLLPMVISLIFAVVLGSMFVPPRAPIGVLLLGTGGLILAILPYACLYRARISPAADRVILDGDLLHVTRGRQEAAIPVRSIAAIRSVTCVSPETITLELSTNTELGMSIIFIPPARFPSMHEHPILGPLRATMQLG